MGNNFSVFGVSNISDVNRQEASYEVRFDGRVVLTAEDRKTAFAIRDAVEKVAANVLNKGLVQALSIGSLNSSPLRYKSFRTVDDFIEASVVGAIGLTVAMQFETNVQIVRRAKIEPSVVAAEIDGFGETFCHVYNVIYPTAIFDLYASAKAFIIGNAGGEEEEGRAMARLRSVIEDRNLSDLLKVLNNMFGRDKVAVIIGESGIR